MVVHVQALNIHAGAHLGQVQIAARQDLPLLHTLPKYKAILGLPLI